MTERQFQQQVLNLATFYGWRSYHTHDSRRSQPGFPDLVLIRAPELIFAELKTAKGRVRPEQAEWIADLDALSTELRHDLEQLDHESAVCVEVHLWRPADFDDVHSRLARGRHRQPVLYREEAA